MQAAFDANKLRHLVYVNFLPCVECGDSVLNHDVAAMSLSALIDTSKTSLFISLGSITFNPTVWNIVARNGKPGHFIVPLSASTTDSWPVNVCKKNTATRRSLAFWGAMLIWVVIS
jgi:hypothetical protein